MFSFLPKYKWPFVNFLAHCNIIETDYQKKNIKQNKNLIVQLFEKIEK